MIYSLYPGRFQPFHQGHAAIVQGLLDEGKSVCIALRDTPKGDTDPYSIEERTAFIEKFFILGERVKVITIPDIEEIVYGRKVGYKIREVHLSPELESISATQIRHDNLDNGQQRVG
jgi:adenylylsulfate kinase